MVRQTWMALSTRALLAAGLSVLAACGGSSPNPERSAPSDTPRRFELPVTLFFPGDGGLLYGENQAVSTTGEAEEQVRAVVASLLAGPSSAELAAPFPPGVELATVFVSSDGVAYIDFKGDGATPPPGGSTEEMQRVFSVVNTVTLNVAEVSRVVLLWNGVQPETFGGHLDISRPLAPDRRLLAR